MHIDTGAVCRPAVINPDRTMNRITPFLKLPAVLFCLTGMVQAQCLRTVNVSSSSALASAVSGAQPGDCIVLANGNYSGFTMTKSGNASNPITIEAANQGQATINSGVVELSGANYVTLQGLTVTTSGGNLTVDGVVRAVGFALINASHCEVTRCTFKLSGAASGNAWIFLGDNSQSNRIDYCEFGPNSVGGHTHYIFPCGDPTIAGVTPPSDRTSWANGNGPYNPNMARYTEIDHNYFHDQASGAGEIIVPGGIGVTGDYQGTFTTIEYNLFVNCNGDAEVVSVKSSTNTVRYNTLRTSAGVISLRSGNGSSVYGNFILCGGTGGGVKVNEMNHKVYNNYIENSDTGNYPIMLENGDPYSSSSFAHARVVNAQVTHNTVVNPGRQFLVGHGSSTLPPTNCVVANNIITGSGTLYSETSGANLVRSQNIIHGFTPSQSGFIVEDPQLTSVTENGTSIQKLSSSSPAINAANTSYYSYVTDDMDGQPRDSQPDIGADEFASSTILRQPLTTSDVGPNASSGDFAIAVSPGSESVNAGSSATYTVTITGSGGFSGNVALSASGLPSGASASFSPASVSGSGTSTMTVTTSSSTPANTSTLTITGTSGSLSHSATTSLGVMNFTISATPSSQTVAVGGSAGYTVNVGTVNGFSGAVTFSASGLPTGASAAFNPTSVNSLGSSALTISTSSSTPSGNYTVTVTGTSGSLSQSTTVTLAVTDFSVSASPASQTVTAGNGTSYTATVGALNGFSGSVALGVSGLPSGASGSFNPASVSGSGTSTLTVTTTTNTAPGTYSLTVTGASGSLTHTASLSLIVNAAGGGLPSGWTDQDIGAVGLAGSASFSGGTFTVSGSGADIFNTGDQFNFAYESVSGDQTVTARVASENGAQPYAKAGVMIRESLATNAVEASVLLTPTNGVALEVRPTTGASTVNVTGWIKGLVPPYWVRLVRTGSTFTGFTSSNGTSWAQIATTNLTMATAAEAGLAVTAHTNAQLNTAHLDNVSIVSPAPDFTISASPASQTVTAGNGTSYTATIGALNGFSGSVALSVSGLPTGASGSFNPASVSGSGNSTLSVSTGTNTAAGTYTVTITGTSGTLVHSTTTTLTVNPAAGGCLTLAATGVWTNTTMTTETGTFTATLDVTPSVSPISAAVGLSQGAQTAISGFACLPIFATSGVIQARNGGAYAADNNIPYSAGVTYHFRMVVNVATHTYSTYVTPAGGSEIAVGANYAFRTEQNGVTSLNNWGALVNTSPAGTLQVCNFTLQ